jgi:hypothetical protein
LASDTNSPVIQKIKELEGKVDKIGETVTRMEMLLPKNLNERWQREDCDTPAQREARCKGLDNSKKRMKAWIDAGKPKNFKYTPT